MGHGPSHHSHPKKERKSTNNNAPLSKPAVFLDKEDPIFKEDGIFPRPVMPEAVPPLALPSIPPPSRPRELIPPVPPIRKPSPVPPPVPPHSSSFSNLHQHQQITPSKSSPLPRSPNFRDESHGGSVMCKHGDPDDKMLVVQNRFIAQTPREISVEEGDLLYLLAESTSQWWYVSNKSRQLKGHVPKSHVAFAEVKQPWFAGNISSILAEQRVMQPGLPIGTFLIRENTKKGTFVLTVRSSHDDPPKAYTIHRQPNDGGFEMKATDGHTIIKFETLFQLVSHFKCEKVPGEVQICTVLREAAPPLEEQSEYVTMRQWQVNRNEVRKVESIGKGQFGEVYRAKWKHADVAVKMLKTGEVDQIANEIFLEEAKTLTRLAHQNVICLVAVCAIDQPYLIITEYMKNGSLLMWMQKLKKTLPPPILMSQESALKSVLIGASISAQVALGMDYLSANHIVHRDLAARNVLVGEVSSNGVPLVKVADFGLARKMSKVDFEMTYIKKTDNLLPWKWLAPESVNEEVFNTKTDVWSYGILLWEIGTFGEAPYRGWDFDHTMEQIENGYVLPKPELVPECVYEDAFKMCVQLNPTKRLTFDRLFKYFDGINAESLSASRGVSRK